MSDTLTRNSVTSSIPLPVLLLSLVMSVTVDKDVTYRKFVHTILTNESSVLQYDASRGNLTTWYW